MINKDLKKRIIELSYANKLSHIGSCITAVDIIETIYQIKNPDDPFILSSGHAGLALYTVIEKHEGIDAQKIFNHHGVHPDRCEECHLYVSTGSLGHGLPIALGMALADRSKTVYCLISDGEAAEGSIWEALRIREEQKAFNLRIWMNMNGYSALQEIDRSYLRRRMNAFSSDISIEMTDFSGFPFLDGVNAHYYVMKEADYTRALKSFK